ncbi:hypothetical protein N7493_006794 [Penicillium malachiteum]|uniref:Uncharacterized protein n=1 Tax=Penicillium malachiteum TaxID=1324776 RepID=A0AAD6HJD2_9EURO|nr:hypothetical protein N7493_006794 [Penicillium malachiteum]
MVQYLPEQHVLVAEGNITEVLAATLAKLVTDYIEYHQSDDIDDVSSSHIHMNLIELCGHRVNIQVQAPRIRQITSVTPSDIKLASQDEPATEDTSSKVVQKWKPSSAPCAYFERDRFGLLARIAQATETEIINDKAAEKGFLVIEGPNQAAVQEAVEKLTNIEQVMSLTEMPYSTTIVLTPEVEGTIYQMMRYVNINPLCIRRLLFDPTVTPLSRILTMKAPVTCPFIIDQNEWVMLNHFQKPPRLDVTSDHESETTEIWKGFVFPGLGKVDAYSHLDFTVPRPPVSEIHSKHSFISSNKAKGNDKLVSRGTDASLSESDKRSPGVGSGSVLKSDSYVDAAEEKIGRAIRTRRRKILEEIAVSNSAVEPGTTSTPTLTIPPSIKSLERSEADSDMNSSIKSGPKSGVLLEIAPLSSQEKSPSLRTPQTVNRLGEYSTKSVSDEVQLQSNSTASINAGSWMSELNGLKLELEERDIKLPVRPAKPELVSPAIPFLDLSPPTAYKYQLSGLTNTASTRTAHSVNTPLSPQLTRSLTPKSILANKEPENQTPALLLSKQEAEFSKESLLLDLDTPSPTQGEHEDRSWIYHTLSDVQEETETQSICPSALSLPRSSPNPPNTSVLPSISGSPEETDSLSQNSLKDLCSKEFIPESRTDSPVLNEASRDHTSLDIPNDSMEANADSPSDSSVPQDYQYDFHPSPSYVHGTLPWSLATSQGHTEDIGEGKEPESRLADQEKKELHSVMKQQAPVGGQKRKNAIAFLTYMAKQPVVVAKADASETLNRDSSSTPAEEPSEELSSSDSMSHAMKFEAKMAVEKERQNALRIEQTKSLFSLCKRFLDPATYYPEILKLEVQFGLALLPSGPGSLNPQKMSLRGLREFYCDRDGLGAPELSFFNRLTTSPADIDHIINIEVTGSRLFERESFYSRVNYEFHCEAELKKFIITVSEHGTHKLTRPDTVLGTIHLSFPSHIWDAAITLRSQMNELQGLSEETTQAVLQLVQNLSVMPGQIRVRLSTRMHPAIKINKIFMKRTTEHRHLQSRDGEGAEEDIYLHITETQDLIISVHGTNNQVIQAHCGPLKEMAKANRQWWSASLTSPILDTVLMSNTHIQPGEQTKEWTPADLFGDDTKHLPKPLASTSDETDLDPNVHPSDVAAAVGPAGISSLVRLAETVVSHIDVVGGNNSGPGETMADSLKVKSDKATNAGGKRSEKTASVKLPATPTMAKKSEPKIW